MVDWKRDQCRFRVSESVRRRETKDLVDPLNFVCFHLCDSHRPEEKDSVYHCDSRQETCLRKNQTM